jgi:phosphate transport system substrate-binding protein
MLRWLKGFSQYYPNIVISVPVFGSQIAGPCLANNSCNMSVVSREMLLTEQANFMNAWHYKPFEVPIAGGSFAALGWTDGMTVMVHPSNPLYQLNYAQFDAIFSTTRNRLYLEDITIWGQLGIRGAMANQPIHLYGVSVPNGFEYYLNRTILLGGLWKSNIQTEKTVFELATLVSEDPLAMGYTGLAYLNASVKLLALSQEGSWPYAGSLDEVYFTPDKVYVCSREYPLSRLIYLYANKNPSGELNPLILEFLNYILSYEGQKDVEDDMIFLPLPLKVVLKLRQQLGLQ